jgi:hypothetical protein
MHRSDEVGSDTVDSFDYSCIAPSHMFVSDEAYEVPFLSQLEPTGMHSFRVMGLSTHMPWHLLSCRVAEGNARMVQTVCIALDSDLLEVLSQYDQRDIVSLQQMVPRTGSGHGWLARDIESVWTAKCSDSGEAVTILRDTTGAEHLCLAAFNPFQTAAQRTLVARIGKRSSRRARPGNATGTSSV